MALVDCLNPTLSLASGFRLMHDFCSLAVISSLYIYPIGWYGNGMAWWPSLPASLSCIHGEMETQEVL